MQADKGKIHAEGIMSSTKAKCWCGSLPKFPHGVDGGMPIDEDSSGTRRDSEDDGIRID